MNRSSGPRSFNTVKRSNRQARLKRRQQGRIVLLAICAALLLLAVSGLGLLIGNVAVALRGRAQTPTPPTGNGTDPTPTLTYSQVSLPYADIRTGELIVVNKNYVYTFPATRLENLDADSKLAYDLTQYRQSMGGVNPYYLNLTKTLLMQPKAAQALNAMLTQYYTLSGDPTVTVFDAYRSAEDQQGSGSLAPGYSEHHTALNVRLRVLASNKTYADLNANTHPWIYEHCHEYGFIQRYPANKVGQTQIENYGECFRYVGVAHATYIKQNNLCLEEYVKLLRDNHTSALGTDGKHLPIDTNGDGAADYEVYYVPASTGAIALTSVPGPTDHAYTVSGDNIGGFIVTVHLNTAK